MKLTKSSINNLPIKDSKYYIMDGGLDNFGIKVYPSGKKTYIVRVRFKTSKKEYAIGDVANKTIGQAKDEARDIIKQYKNGVDVKAEEKKNQLKDKTLGQCIEDYLTTVKKGSQSSIIKAKKIWDKEGWLKKPLRKITQLMVLRLYDKRVIKSFHGARQEAAYLRSIWNLNKKDLNLIETPTLILNEERKGWSKKTVKTRRLDFETASKFYNALDTLPYRDRNLFLLSYFTGMRAEEMMQLEWSNIDLNNKSLHIPDSKTGQPLDIPLNTHAIDILLSILNGEFKHKRYIFTQVNKAGNVEPMKYYSKSLTKLKNQGVLWSPHDSRRGFITCADVIGISHYMAKQLTNHVIDQDIHGGYIHYTIAEMRQASQRIADELYKQLNA
jgi:integrase